MIYAIDSDNILRSAKKGVKIHMTSCKKVFKTAAVTIFFGLIMILSTNGFAQDVSVQKLLEVEEQLREEQKNNDETKAAIVQLEKKVQCTYGMVKGYESCDASFSEKSEDYFACIQQARQEKEDCMLELAAESP
jgi:hypothetical protein